MQGANYSRLTVMNKKPKILFLHQSGELYGSDVVFVQIIDALKTFVDPIIVLDNPGPLVERLRDAIGGQSPILIHPLGVLRRRSFTPSGILSTAFHIITAVWWLARLVHRESADIVYSNTIAVLPGAFAATITRRPHIWHIHEIVIKPRLLGAGLSLVTRTFSHVIIANSQATAQNLAAECLVVYNGISVSRFDEVGASDIRHEFGVSDDDVLIVLIGRIHYPKGQDLLIDVAYHIICNGISCFKVMLVGDVYPGYEWVLENLRSQVEELGLKSHIFFCGFRSDVPAILKAADIAVAPSTQPESFGLGVVEAMAAGKPVVATALGGPLEIIDDGITGFLVPPDDPDQIAVRLIQLIQDKELRLQMGKRGRKRLEARFSIEAFNKRIRDIVLDVLLSE